MERARKYESRIFLVLTGIMFNGYLIRLDLEAIDNTNEPFIIGLPAI